MVKILLDLSCQRTPLLIRKKRNFQDPKNKKEVLVISKECVSQVKNLESDNDKWLFICDKLGDKFVEVNPPKLDPKIYKYNKQYKKLMLILDRNEHGYPCDKLLTTIGKTLEQVPKCLASVKEKIKNHIKWSHDKALNSKMKWWEQNYATNSKHLPLIPYEKFPKDLRQFLIYKDWYRLSIDIKHSNPVTQIGNILNSMDFGKIKDESKYYKYIGNNTSLSNLLNKATLIGTDGSCNNNIAGYDIVTDQNVSISSHTLGQGTSYNSEVQAFHTVVRLLDNNTPRTTVIDAKSIYDQLFQFRKSRHPYVEEIRNYLKVKDQIKIMHINSHTGKQDIYSRINELEDRAAKKGADCNNILTNIPSNNWYIIINNVLYTQNTRQTMYKLIFQRLHKRTYTPKNLPPKNRKFTNIYPSIGIGFRTLNLIFKIRVNVMKTLENLNKISKTNLLCPCCSRETMQHIIFECKYCSDIRKEMFRNLYNISIYAKNNRKFSKRLLYLIKTKQDIHSLTGAKVGLGKKWDKVFTKEAY
ncbi:hypothetical protein FDP41_008855 [Naegleria fowleri]|uniref:RNase H type-1 domain-containing protein n=1 Tax=Naegleria fowleri TaxID=5763 RepID=A0A6A5BD44_NAEFO|nr:uncharacterized protein FDP41_008855 [Naegleria fowleri]KAF0972606.1 hypothetical protein FDP41_008855 [Naegleria fowleri]